MEHIQNIISVIVPVYKVEEWLDQCISSIINQTYRDVEIILVDDGSPDRCPQMCDEWAKKDKRIRVIHKENGGLSDARNAGLDICTGEWITFVDSDDWLHHQALEKMIDLVQSEHAKLVMASYQQVGENELVDEVDISNVSYDIIGYEDAVMMLYQKGKAQVVSWGKLYHRSLWTQHRFPVGKVNEDEFTTYKLMYDSQKMVFTTCALYYYRIREESIMSDLAKNQNLDILDALWERQNFFEEHQIDNLAKININALLSKLLDKAVLVKDGTPMKKNIMEQLTDIVEYKAEFTKQNVVKRWLFMVSPILYAKIMELWRMN